MEWKGIDVSSYQGKPDWSEVKRAGIEFAILRIYQYDGIDASFAYNYQECAENEIPVGGYTFSYAKTPEEARAEADKTLEALEGRKMEYPVFYDMEWSEQRELGTKAVTEIAGVFLEKVRLAGYQVGIYCNLDWYKNVLDTAKLPYDFWLAAYPADDQGILVESLRPSVGVGWQYSSKGRIPGIAGNVDLDIFYKDYAGEKDGEQRERAEVTNALTLRLPVIRKEYQGTAVRMLQTMISTPVTGFWRDEDIQVFRAFQKNTGLDPDGICGPKSWTAVAEHMKANTFR